MLSSGFCDEAATALFTPAQLSEWRSRHGSPMLQVVDIQRFPRRPRGSDDVSVFYVALSDGVSLMWMVVPPRSQLEEVISSFQIDVGCVVTISAFHLTRAANGFNVIIPLSLESSPDSFSLLGAPKFDTALFELSERAITRQITALASTTHANRGERVAAAVDPPRELVLSQLRTHPELAMAPWSVTLRIVHKGVERSVGARRTVLHCIGVDREGSAIGCSFWGKEAAGAFRFCVNDVAHLSEGNVAWSEDGEPAELQFGNRAVCTLVDGVNAFPLHPSKIVGKLASDITTVASVLHNYKEEDAVSLLCRVAAVSPSMPVNTKRGRVQRRTVSVCDTDAVSASRVSIDVTLWDAAAEHCALLPGDHCVFLNFVVKEFMGRRNLSARFSSVCLKLSPPSAFTEPSLTPTQSQPHAIAEGALSAGSQIAVSPVENEAVDREPQALSSTATEAAFNIVLDLSEASSTVPALLRVQDVRFPLRRRVCAGCGVFMSPAEPCSHCGSVAPPREELAVEVALSDGLEMLWALCTLTAAEHLLEDARHNIVGDSRAEYEWAVRQRLNGTPVIAWILPSSHQGELPLLVNCRHADYSGCAKVLISSINELMSL